MSTPAYTLTIEELRELVRSEIRSAVANVNGAVADADEVLTRDGAARLLKCDPHKVAKLVKTDGLPGHRLGTEWRFRRGEVLAWLSLNRGSK